MVTSLPPNKEAIEQLLSDGYISEFCPVTLEPFTFENPPFKTDRCCHHFSKSGLSKLAIVHYIIQENKELECSFNYCPLCGRLITFALIDFSHLRLIYLRRLLVQSKGDFIGTIINKYFISILFCLCFQPKFQSVILPSH